MYRCQLWTPFQRWGWFQWSQITWRVFNPRNHFYGKRVQNFREWWLFQPPFVTSHYKSDEAFGPTFNVLKWIKNYGVNRQDVLWPRWYLCEDDWRHNILLPFYIRSDAIMIKRLFLAFKWLKVSWVCPFQFIRYT